MDYTVEDLTKYKQYLNTLDQVLTKYFDDQKEFIFCQKGCSHCCEEGTYPLSELEYAYLLLGFFKIPPVEQRKVIQRIQKLKEEYKKTEDKKNFHHRCPFLSEDKVCTVYEHRALICRTFGLLTITSEGKCVVPFCNDLGLNYSNVFNYERRGIDFELVKKLGCKSKPKPYNTNLRTLMSPSMFEGEPIDFGEVKTMMEFL